MISPSQRSLHSFYHILVENLFDSRANRRSMFRTDFPYVTGNLGQFTIIRGKQGRASKETGAWKCTDVRFLDSWSDEDNDEKGLVLRKFRRGDEEANWWTPISTPELPFAAFRPCIIVAFALNTRIPSPSCGNAAVSRIKRPSAYLSYPPRRIPRNSMLGRFLLGCSILEENSLLAGPNLFT